MTQSLGTMTISFGPPETSERKYICRICSKAFKRGEHCIRHERGHAREKPFGCQYCQKRYSRRELLVRHQRALHATEQPQSKEKVDSPPRPQLYSSTNEIHAEAEIYGQSPKCRDTISTDIDLTLSEGFSNHQERTEGTGESVHESLSAGQMQHDTHGLTSIGFTASYPDNLSPGEPNGIFEGENPDSIGFFDVFADWSADQMADFALPPLNDQFMEGLSTSVQGQNASQQVAASGISLDAHSTINYFPETPLVASNQEDFAPARNSQAPSCSVPHVIKHKCSTVVIRFTEDMHRKLLIDLSGCVSHDTLQLLHPFSAVSLERCLQRYIETFHTHVPIFHPSTLDLSERPSPLILAMCAIGAVYRMERKLAAIFYNLAHQSLGNMGSTRARHQPSENFLQKWIKPNQTPSKIAPTPLWGSQTTLLLTVFAMLSGDPELSLMGIDQLCFFAQDFRTRLTWLQSHNSNLDQLSWESWIERESVKRLLYGHLYLCSLNSMLFGITPGFSMLTDGKLEMPCHHTLWDAPNAEQWRLLTSARGYSSPLTLKDAVERLLNGTYLKDIPERYWIWDPYSCNVAMIAVSIYISHLAQGSHFLSEGPINPEADSVHQSVITKQMETAINKCLHLIKRARARADNSYTWNETEGPLLFNSLALLRVSYCKTLTRTHSVCRAMFFRDNEADFEASIQNFLSETLEWNEFLTRAIAVALESIMIPARIGCIFVKKTAAFTWAIEHAFSAWDSILLLTKWLHVIEIRKRQGFPLYDSETTIVQKLCNMLAEEDASMTSKPSLAAALARSWADYYDDTWVWGVTPKMGRMLRELADRYEAGAFAD